MEVDVDADVVAVVFVVDVVVAVVVVVLMATVVKTACIGLLENISTKLWKSGLGLGVEGDDGLEVLSVSFFLLLNIDVSKSLDDGDRMN